jgi:hypothetical protein
MYLTEDQILEKSAQYSKAHAKDGLQQLCLQQGYAGGYDDAQEAETMGGVMTPPYNQAIDDILLKIVKKEVDGIRMNYPPEALIHVRF